MKCNICPRECGVDRDSAIRSVGYCGETSEIKLARAALHYWEEPCISGIEGSGAVFFSGCNLKCIYCQNRDIALGHNGKIISVERLAEIFLELQDKKANNINLVTGNHYIPQIVTALKMAKDNGLYIPIVYNTSSYEKVDSLKMLEGLVDVYLPDMKYADSALAKAYSNAEDYPEVAKNAIGEMIRQRPQNSYNDLGIIESGVIVRHMILPGHTVNSKMVIDYLLGTYGQEICISIMNQYTPNGINHADKELNRTVTKREYKKVIDYAISKGLVNGFFQEGKTQLESFIPKFNNEGV